MKTKPFDGVKMGKTKPREYKIGNKKLKGGLKNIKMFEEFSVDEAESLGNLGILHKDSAGERLTKWQKENKDTVITSGDNVKMAFVDGNETEHMWVEITKVIDKDNFEGVINNEPVAVNNVNLGDKIKVKRSDIEQLFVD